MNTRTLVSRCLILIVLSFVSKAFGQDFYFEANNSTGYANSAQQMIEERMSQRVNSYESNSQREAYSLHGEEIKGERKHNIFNEGKPYIFETNLLAVYSKNLIEWLAHGPNFFRLIYADPKSGVSLALNNSPNNGHLQLLLTLREAVKFHSYETNQEQLKELKFKAKEILGMTLRSHTLRGGITYVPLTEVDLGTVRDTTTQGKTVGYNQVTVKVEFAHDLLPKKFAQNLEVFREAVIRKVKLQETLLAEKKAQEKATERIIIEAKRIDIVKQAVKKGKR